MGEQIFCLAKAGGKSAAQMRAGIYSELP